MELVAALVLFAVLALALSCAVAVLLLLLSVVRGPGADSVARIRGLSAVESDWDDEEISARNHG
ncbi:MAG: hypothetical protein QOC59_172 [Microbacteriaceae bacterium]|nr:hypothetical protein [Microbacteriaceae bacterium]